MPNNGVLNYNLPINGSFTIPLGYTTGGTITQSITTKSAQTYQPSTTAQTITNGQYLSGIQTIAPVTGNATINDVVSGKGFSSANGINLVGQATIQSLGGVKYVTGTCTGTTASGDGLCTTTLSLSFTPKIVRVSGTVSLTVHNSGTGAVTAIPVQVYAIYLIDLSKALIGDININTTANNKLSYSVNSVTSLNNIPIQHAGSNGDFTNNSVSLTYEAWA
ncbi:hypothetical protein CLOBE_00010 [Clostridium beijerinckii]|nr:hypothetical protein CLOBE_00010 [Clostridium beijerinckii]